MEPIKTENRLYYYCKIDTALKHILPEQRLLLSPLDKTNDPRETKDLTFQLLSSPVPKSKNNDAILEEVNAAVNQNCKVICFSQDHNPYYGYEYSRMWAHYGEQHEGLCLLLDKEEFLKENAGIINEAHFKKINYYELDLSKPREAHKCIDHDQLEELGLEKYVETVFAPENLDYLYFTKNVEWESEREMRLVHFSQNRKNEFCSIQRSLKHVYLGVDFNHSHSPALTKFCPVIEFSQMKFSDVRLVAQILQ